MDVVYFIIVNIRWGDCISAESFDVLTWPAASSVVGCHHPTTTANCIIIDHFSAFESELVALFSHCRLKTAGDGSKRPEI